MVKIYKMTRDDILSSNCYIVASGNEAVVIDPSVSYEAVKAHYPEIQELDIKYILLTHTHIDHFWQINSYVRCGGKVLVPCLDVEGLKDTYYNCADFIAGEISGFSGDYLEITAGQTVNFGTTSIELILTPGHTKGSVCYLIENSIFTGDTLFASGGYGRCDLPGGNISQLTLSLKRLFNMDDRLNIYPGHGDITTLGETKKYFY